jgi:hypothetical protein
METRRWRPAAIVKVCLPMVTVLLFATLAMPCLPRRSTSVSVPVSMHVRPDVPLHFAMNETVAPLAPMRVMLDVGGVVVVVGGWSWS